MAKGKCRECVAYHSKGDEFGSCRMYAPQVVVVKDAIKGAWPHVQARDGCEEWAPKNWAEKYMEKSGSNAKKNEESSRTAAHSAPDREE